MTQQFVLALDAGNGSGRSALIDLDTGAITHAQRHWNHAIAPGTDGLGRDLDLDQIWSKLCAATREVLTQTSAAPDQIVAIACTSMRHGLVVLDSDGHALYAGPTSDARAIMSGFGIVEGLGEQLHASSGRWPMPTFPAVRLKHLASEDPDAFARAHVAFSISDWLAFKLSGERATDPTQAIESLLLNLDTRTWSEDACKTLHIPMDLLPPVRQPGEPLGALTTAAAENLGLKPGICIAVGGADTACGLLGMGITAPGEAGIVAGTTTPVQVVVDGAPLDPKVWTGPYLSNPWNVVESNAGAMGTPIEFTGELLFANTPNPAARLLAEAAASTPGANGTLASCGAQIMNAAQMKMPQISFTFSHLGDETPAETRHHLARAVAEAAAYAVRGNLEQAEEIAGKPAHTVTIGGGLSRSTFFVDLVASVLGRHVARGRVAETTVLGAGLCAAVAAGRFPDLATAAKTLASPSEIRDPDPSDAPAYTELYAEWHSFHEARSAADEIAAGAQIRARMSQAGGEIAGNAASIKPRILVTADLDEQTLATLRALGEVTYRSYRDPATRKSGAALALKGDELVEALKGFEVFITEIDIVDVDALLALPDLRVVATCRGNPVNVDIPACSALGIPVINAPGRNAQAVADLTLAYMLMLARRMPLAQSVLRRPGVKPGDYMSIGRETFAQMRGNELWHQTVGLIGLGAVGREVVKRLNACDAHVLVYDPYVPAEVIVRAGAEPVSLDDLLARSDFVSLHAAVSDESQGLLGQAEIEKTKPGVFLINSARAALWDEAAVVAALESGHVAGAAIDTFSIEPPGADHPLLQFDQVIVTPHIGGNTAEVSIHQGEIISNALAAVLASQTDRAIVNDAMMDTFSWAWPRPKLDAAMIEVLRSGPGPATTDLDRDKNTEKKS